MFAPETSTLGVMRVEQACVIMFRGRVVVDMGEYIHLSGHHFEICSELHFLVEIGSAMTLEKAWTVQTEHQKVERRTTMVIAGYKAMALLCQQHSEIRGLALPHSCSDRPMLPQQDHDQRQVQPGCIQQHDPSVAVRLLVGQLPAQWVAE